ncbi:unnamed protein product [Rotaria sordida]|uniref:Fibronectin type-III domain-containing protein n=1 Tax=Rotaria sordida TaxID=392033 RepID=A0A813WUV7_9BILA|nr:unnamed protein product [Rotaria sordida]CAF3539263.1 unnamed protein product [Rotaria sordida]
MTTKVQWKRLDTTIGSNPKPRHGHRAVAVKDLIIIFGGGNDGIVEDLNVFNCATNQWFQPLTKGDIPTGCAAFGFATDGARILVFGGMIEYGKYSADLWELNPITWQWKKIKARPPRTSSLPCARLGHTLTYVDGKYYLFGGLANDSKDPKQNVPRYLNDLYTLEYKSNNYSWEQPIIRSMQPIERESHSCVSYRAQIENRSKLIIYGGMNGHRLGDIWSYYLDLSQWTQITASGLAPQPRSLHSSVVLGHRMFVFGGWVPLVSSDRNEQYVNEKEWRCTNTLASLNLETNTWELLGQECLDDNIPRARAGHCAVAVNTGMYIWSGRDGYRKAWNNQVCCKDLWCLETACPGEPEKVQLLKAGIGNLEISWNPVPTADSYILQIQRFEAPIEQSHPAPSITSQTPINPSSIPLQSISASLFASKSPQSVLASLIPTFSNEQQPASASVSAISDTDTNVDQRLSPSTLLNKSTSDLLSLSHLSSSQTSLSSPMNTINSQTLSTVSQSSNSTTNPTLLFQKPTSSNISSHPTQTIRPTMSSNIQFINASANSTVRPIIFHQKTTTTSTQPQLLTVMPAGVRFQQLTPVVRTSTTQPTTIVRLMSPTTSTIRSTTGQQQFIQFNTNKQQQPLVIKAITASNRLQQPILLTTNTQQKTISPQTQQQVLVLNQNTLNNNQGQTSKLTLSMTNIDPSNSINTNHSQQTSTNDNTMPQLDGCNSIEISSQNINRITTVDGILEILQKQISIKNHYKFIPQIDGTIDDQSLQNGTSSVLQNSSSPTQQQTTIMNTDSQQSLNNHEISQTTMSNGNTKIETTNDLKPTENEDDNSWHLVGTFKTTTADIRHYYVVPSQINNNNYDLPSLQVQNLVKKVDLEPGVIYKLRIAAVNSCGQGPWSEAAAFKTCLPGAPPAPSNIKITKTSDGGAHLTWDAPSNASCLITGYAVYLAVKNTTTDNTIPRQHQQQASQMAFVRVYGGALAECSVYAGQLLQAHLDISSSSKPAIIFRIAARNERGYGPATQVRWLQDQQQIPYQNSTINNSLKRTSSNVNSTGNKKQRLAPIGGGSSDT